MSELAAVSNDQPNLIELDITGMTCASCAARIEKKLNRMPEVSASVNYATERATVTVSAQVSAEQLIGVVEAAGYGAKPHIGVGMEDEGEHISALRRRMILALVLGAPVVVLAMVPAWQFIGWQWISLVLATIVIWWCGWGFHRAALVNARHGALTMDTLISIGTSAAYLWSLYALFFGHAGTLGMTHEFSLQLSRNDGLGNIYFEAGVGIVAFLLIGRFIEARSKAKAGSALRALLALGAKEATVLREGVETLVPIGAVRVGDQFVVRPGEKVATDGQVVQGASAIDSALITGESVPVEVLPGDEVIGGTLNTTGRLVVRATAIGANTQLAQIATLIEKAQSGKANVQRLADKVSGVFVPIVIAISVITLISWLAVGAGAGFAFTAAVAVLIIACPCALGLATPTALLVGTGRGAQLGIVISGPEALERARGINTILLDKTGTITTGQMKVVGIHPHGVDEAELLALAGAVESASEHPVAKAVVQAAQDVSAADRARLEGYRAELRDFTNLPGKGVLAKVGQDEVVIGNSSLMMEMTGFDDPGGELTVIHVARANQWLGCVEVADTVKETSARAVAELKALGLSPVLLSGDRQAVANRVAAQVGIQQVIAEALPGEKLAQVVRYQASGRVAMVGDGVNDAAALTQADLGVAMGSGADVAIAASDLTLMRPDLMLAADAIRLSRRTLRTIRGNLFWAFAYNSAAVPVAALGLLNPMIAGAAMAFSSVFVVLNSLRLRTFQPTL